MKKMGINAENNIVIKPYITIYEDPGRQRLS